MSPTDADSSSANRSNAGETRTDAASLTNLFSLNKRQADDRLGLGRQLRIWSECKDGAAVAVYAEIDDAMVRLACAGEADLPAKLDGETPDGFERLELPGVVVLHEASADDTLLLVAAGGSLTVCWLVERIWVGAPPGGVKVRIAL